MLSILWDVIVEKDAQILYDAAKKHGARLLRVPAGELAALMMPSLARGGVVVVVGNDVEAGRALGLGADEVVRAGHLTEELVEDSIARALARAEARASRETLARRGDDDDAVALGLLAGAVGHGVNNPLASATLDCEHLAEVLPPLLDLNALLIRWAEASVPPERWKVVREKASALPKSADIQESFDALRTAIGNAAEGMRRFTSLAANDGTEPVCAAEVVHQLLEILRPIVRSDAELTTEIRGEGRVRVPCTTLICLVGALIAHAIEIVRTSAKKRTRPRIRLRLSDEDDLVLLELDHDGPAVATDLRLSTFEPLFRNPGGAAPATGLLAIRERARRWDGEFLVLGEEGRTIYRLVLPCVEEPAAEVTQRRKRSLRPNNTDN